MNTTTTRQPHDGEILGSHWMHRATRFLHRVQRGNRGMTLHALHRAIRHVRHFLQVCPMLPPALRERYATLTATVAAL